MKIVVIDGIEPVATKLVRMLGDLGHDVSAVSPAFGVDTITGQGLDEALRGAQVVVDLTTAPSLEEGAALDFFRRSVRNLFAAEEAANVKHHVSVSIVGTERLRNGGYFRGKWVQEMLVRASRISNTIVHITQPFEYLSRIAQYATEGRVVRLPPALVQPVAADDIAAALAEVATHPQARGTLELAGPERFSLAELCERFLSAHHDARNVIADTRAKYFGVEVDDGSLLPTARARIGSIRFADWLLRQSVNEMALT